MIKRTTPRRLYLIPVLSKALDVLELLENANGALTLETIFQRTNISKTTVYRILKTFAHRGYLVQSEYGLYRLVARLRKATFGFGGESAEMPFSEAVRDSLQAAATAAGVDLVLLDNRYDGATALRNVDQFIKRKVDVIIEFQIDRRVAPVIADKIDSAGIPLIAVDIPHPHATYFGVDNYRVGFEAGQLLAQYAKQRWDSKVRWVLGLDIEEAGPLVQSRVTGAFEGVRSKLPTIPEEFFVRLDGRGIRETSYLQVLEFLQRHPKDRGILIAAATDTSGLGAVRAVKELRRGKQVAIVGQDCIPEALTEMSAANSPLIGSVSHEVHDYGPTLIQLGLALLAGKRVAPYNYVTHRLVTAESLSKGKRT